jgi:hypothetical protein
MKTKVWCISFVVLAILAVGQVCQARGATVIPEDMNVGQFELYSSPLPALTASKREWDRWRESAEVLRPGWQGRIRNRQFLMWTAVPRSTVRAPHKPSSPVRDDNLRRLSEISALKGLDLTYCNEITNDGLAHLKALTDLQVLVFSDCRRITDAGMVHVGEIKSLRRLQLLPRITDEGFGHLKGLSNLERLSVSTSQVTDAGLAHLKDMNLLQELVVIGARGVTGTGLRHLVGIKTLRRLELTSDCLTDEGFAQLIKLSSLEHLLTCPRFMCQLL